MIDDHAVVREGLRLLFEREEDLEVVAEASSLADAVECEVEPEVVVADLVLGDRRGAEMVGALSERYPDAALLVLTMVGDPDEVEAALSAGANGYLLKEAAASELVDAVRRVAAGEAYLQPALGVSLARRSERRSRTGAAATPLTPREQEVLRLIALGHTNSEIAGILTVSLRTVESHRANILAKLGVRTRAELVRHAVEAGLADFPPEQRNGRDGS